MHEAPTLESLTLHEPTLARTVLVLDTPTAHTIDSIKTCNMRVVSTILLVVRSFGLEALPIFLHIIYWTTRAYRADLDYFLGVYSSSFFGWGHKDKKTACRVYVRTPAPMIRFES